MRVRSKLKSGQSTPKAAETPEAVVKQVVETMQGSTKDLNFWSLIRVKNPGLSSWTLLSQKPTKAQA
jgi:hypothetical protein